MMIAATQMPTNDYSITTKTEILSDGSKVFNVHFNGVVLHAYDEKAAVKLVDAIWTAVHEHTCDEVTIV